VSGDENDMTLFAVKGTIIKNAFHPQHFDSSFHGANKDFHTAYYGEIVGAYIIE